MFQFYQWIRPETQKNAFRDFEITGITDESRQHIFSDGGDTVRDLQLYLNSFAEYLLLLSNSEIAISTCYKVPKNLAL